MSNTNDDVLMQWAIATRPQHQRKNGFAMQNANGTLSIKDTNHLYSYALRIGTIDPLTEAALVLPRDASSSTTNQHISDAALHAQVSLSIRNVFQLPELDFKSNNNKHYLCEMLNNARASMLNKRRAYKTRHNAVAHWYDVMIDIINYNECLTAHGIATIPTDPEGAIHILENEGGTNFLGQSALESDIHELHRLDKRFQEELESSNG